MLYRQPGFSRIKRNWTGLTVGNGEALFNTESKESPIPLVQTVPKGWIPASGVETTKGFGITTFGAASEQRGDDIHRAGQGIADW